MQLKQSMNSIGDIIVSTFWLLPENWQNMLKIKQKCRLISSNLQGKNWHDRTDNKTNSWNISRRRCHSLRDTTTPNQLKILPSTKKNNSSQEQGENPSTSQYDTANSYSNAKSKNNSFL